MSSRVSIVIVNWNGRHWLEQCLPALRLQTYRDFEVIVVDNGSTDGSVAWLSENCSAVRVLQNKRNVGFAAANNAAISASSAEHVVTLNNDTRPAPNWLGELVASASAPDVGMVASKIVFWDHPDRLDSAGIEVDRAGIGWHRSWGRPVIEAASPCDVFGPCAAAALYRQAMLEDIGLFDEDFFMYYEDVDLAWRAQWAGWRCVYTPEATVYHVHSATAGEGSRFKNRLLGRNKAWTLCKNYPSLWHAPLVLAYDLLAMAYAVAIGQGVGAVQGRVEALGKVPRMLAKRRQIVRRMAPRAMMARLRPLESPLAVARRRARATRGG